MTQIASSSCTHCLYSSIGGLIGETRLRVPIQELELQVLGGGGAAGGIT